MVTVITFTKKKLSDIDTFDYLLGNFQ